MFSPDGGNLNLHCLLRSLHGRLRANIFIKIPGIVHLLITLVKNHNDNNTPPIKTTTFPYFCKASKSENFITLVYIAPTMCGVKIQDT